ncbi:MAG: DUF86 domain-containing protein [Candidatus Hadarchaeota archaeon]|nr:DUF86 domain-containing protein [Candidatus Hadarchaeota archaeon]
MKNDAVYLHHILDSINHIQGYIAGVSYDQFLRNSLLQDGVVRQLEIVGEAAKSVSGTFRDAHPELPWSQMTGIRNKLIHGYFEVDPFIVWDTVQSDLPPLKQQVERILEALGGEHGESEKQ